MIAIGLPHAELLSSVALTAMAGAAAFHDVRTRRIPNGVVLAGLLAALVIRASGGPALLWEGLLGAGLGFVIGLLCFAFGLFGGGDGKFVMGVGAFLGPTRLLVALLVIALVGGVLALFEATRQGILGPALKRTGWTALHLLTGGRFGWRPPPVAVTAEGFTLPYGVAIASGALITWFLGVTLP